MADTTQTLTPAEQGAVRALQRLARSWPRSLCLFAAAGSLHVMRAAQETALLEHCAHARFVTPRWPVAVIRARTNQVANGIPTQPRQRASGQVGSAALPPRAGAPGVRDRDQPHVGVPPTACQPAGRNMTTLGPFMRVWFSCFASAKASCAATNQPSR
jgi:hypothetical protein